MDHEHIWKKSFTETKNGDVVATTYVCQADGCHETKREEGGEADLPTRIYPEGYGI